MSAGIVACHMWSELRWDLREVTLTLCVIMGFNFSHNKRDKTWIKT